MDYYKVLGLDHNASESQIAKMYRKLAMTYHPDRNPKGRNAVARFKAITKAFETLNNPQKRAQYDAERGLDADVVLAEVVTTEQTSSMWYTPGKQSKRQTPYEAIFTDDDELNDDGNDEERKEDGLRNNYYRNNLHKIIVLEEERVGKWIGAACAVLLWLIIASPCVSTRKPQGTFEGNNGVPVPSNNGAPVITAEDRSDSEINIKRSP